MTKKDIPIYHDPDDFTQSGRTIKFPCSTNFMLYDPLMHRYYLTNLALENYGIDIERDYYSETTDKIRQFIEEVSDDIYGVIMHLAPFNFMYHCAQIAQSRALRFPDRYTARKQFEKALLYQARYRLDNIDVRDINGIDLEGNNNIYFKQLRREMRHVSPKSIDILHGLGLLFNGNIPGKAFINYNEVM